MSKAKVILLVDDDEDDHQLFAEAVDEIDNTLECHWCHSGMEALNWLKASKEKLPDLIFLDLNMPRMNGIQFITEIKKIKQLQNIPVAIYTTSNLNSDMKTTAMMGAKYYITKPATFNKICQAIAGVFTAEWDVKYDGVGKR